MRQIEGQFCYRKYPGHLHNGQEYHYDVSYKLLNAADYGVPQHRERLFIVGNRIEKTFSFPKPTHGSIAKIQPDLFDAPLVPYVTTWDTIGHLPPADEPSETAKRVSQTIKGRIEKHGY